MFFKRKTEKFVNQTLIYEFDLQDMPVTVAVDALGTSVHNTAPAEWAEKIRSFKIPVRVA